jgi:cysteine desulfuration protein SufE
MTTTPPTLEEVRENFAFLDGWEDRFAYLIDLGKRLPELPEPYTTEAYRVHGCQSNVWLHLALDDQHRVHVEAKSDAHIVNGLIAVLRSAYHGRTPAEARAFDAAALLKELGLDEHLSPTRRNGLHAMIERIQLLASAAGQDR